MIVNSQVHPYLEVKKPDGYKYILQLDKFTSQKRITCIDIGRENTNQIVLPDPQKRISRYHCSIQKDKGKWWIVDEGSSNGTFIKKIISQSKIDVRQDIRVSLNNGDDIFILGEVTNLEQSVFWRLRFIDPGETNQILNLKNNLVDLEYSLSQGKLFCKTTQGRSVIDLKGQEQTLIDYMIKKNHSNHNQSTICSNDELMKAIWQNEQYGFTHKDIRTLICRIRKKIKLNSKKSQFIITVKNKGYRADIKIID